MGASDSKEESDDDLHVHTSSSFDIAAHSDFHIVDAEKFEEEDVIVEMQKMPSSPGILSDEEEVGLPRFFKTYGGSGVTYDDGATAEFNTKTTLKCRENIDFFEVELILPREGFIGFVNQNFEQQEKVTSGTEVGYNSNSWGVGLVNFSVRIGGPDPFQMQKTESAKPDKKKPKSENMNELRPWGIVGDSWQSGDVIGVYFDRDNDRICFGLNGNWSVGQGVAFEYIHPECKLYPALTMSNSIVKIFIDNDFKYGPPKQKELNTDERHGYFKKVTFTDQVDQDDEEEVVKRVPTSQVRVEKKELTLPKTGITDIFAEESDEFAEKIDPPTKPFQSTTMHLPVKKSKQNDFIAKTKSARSPILVDPPSTDAPSGPPMPGLPTSTDPPLPAAPPMPGKRGPSSPRLADNVPPVSAGPPMPSGPMPGMDGALSPRLADNVPPVSAGPPMPAMDGPPLVSAGPAIPVMPGMDGPPLPNSDNVPPVSVDPSMHAGPPIAGINGPPMPSGPPMPKMDASTILGGAGPQMPPGPGPQIPGRTDGGAAGPSSSQPRASLTKSSTSKKPTKLETDLKSASDAVAASPKPKVDKNPWGVDFTVVNRRILVVTIREDGKDKSAAKKGVKSGMIVRKVDEELVNASNVNAMKKRLSTCPNCEIEFFTDFIDGKHIYFGKNYTFTNQVEGLQTYNVTTQMNADSMAVLQVAHGEVVNISKIDTYNDDGQTYVCGLVTQMADEKKKQKPPKFSFEGLWEAGNGKAVHVFKEGEEYLVEHFLKTRLISIEIKPDDDYPVTFYLPPKTGANPTRMKMTFRGRRFEEPDHWVIICDVDFQIVEERLSQPNLNTENLLEQIKPYTVWKRPKIEADSTGRDLGWVILSNLTTVKNYFKPYSDDQKIGLTPGLYMNCGRKASDYGWFATLDTVRRVTHFRERKRMIHEREKFTIKQIRFEYKEEIKEKGAPPFDAGAYYMDVDVEVRPSSDEDERKAVRKLNSGFVEIKEVVQNQTTKDWWGALAENEFINLTAIEDELELMYYGDEQKTKDQISLIRARFENNEWADLQINDLRYFYEEALLDQVQNFERNRIQIEDISQLKLKFYGKDLFVMNRCEGLNANGEESKLLVGMRVVSLTEAGVGGFDEEPKFNFADLDLSKKSSDREKVSNLIQTTDAYIVGCEWMDCLMLNSDLANEEDIPEWASQRIINTFWSDHGKKLNGFIYDDGSENERRKVVNSDSEDLEAFEESQATEYKNKDSDEAGNIKVDSTEIDGAWWSGAYLKAEIKDGQIHWFTGEITDLTVDEEGKYSTVLREETFTATLGKTNLKWNNGESWSRTILMHSAFSQKSKSSGKYKDKMQRLRETAEGKVEKEELPEWAWKNSSGFYKWIPKCLFDDAEEFKAKCLHYLKVECFPEAVGKEEENEEDEADEKEDKKEYPEEFGELIFHFDYPSHIWGVNSLQHNSNWAFRSIDVKGPKQLETPGYLLPNEHVEITKIVESNHKDLDIGRFIWGKCNWHGNEAWIKLQDKITGVEFMHELPKEKRITVKIKLKMRVKKDPEENKNTEQEHVMLKEFSEFSPGLYRCHLPQSMTETRFTDSKQGRKVNVNEVVEISEIRFIGQYCWRGKIAEDPKGKKEKKGKKKSDDGYWITIARNDDPTLLMSLIADDVLEDSWGFEVSGSFITKMKKGGELLAAVARKYKGIHEMGTDGWRIAEINREPASDESIAEALERGEPMALTLVYNKTAGVYMTLDDRITAFSGPGAKFPRRVRDLKKGEKVMICDFVGSWAKEYSFGSKAGTWFSILDIEKTDEVAFMPKFEPGQYQLVHTSIKSFLNTANALGANDWPSLLVSRNDKIELKDVRRRKSDKKWVASVVRKNGRKTNGEEILLGSHTDPKVYSMDQLAKVNIPAGTFNRAYVIQGKKVYNVETANDYSAYIGEIEPLNCREFELRWRNGKKKIRGRIQGQSLVFYNGDVWSKSDTSVSIPNGTFSVGNREYVIQGKRVYNVETANDYNAYIGEIESLNDLDIELRWRDGKRERGHVQGDNLKLKGSGVWSKTDEDRASQLERSLGKIYKSFDPERPWEEKISGWLNPFSKSVDSEWNVVQMVNNHVYIQHSSFDYNANLDMKRHEKVESKSVLQIFNTRADSFFIISRIFGDFDGYTTNGRDLFTITTLDEESNPQEIHWYAQRSALQKNAKPTEVFTPSRRVGRICADHNQRYVAFVEGSKIGSKENQDEYKVVVWDIEAYDETTRKFKTIDCDQADKDAGKLVSVEWSPDDQFLVIKTERVNANRGNRQENLLTILDVEKGFTRLVTIKLDSIRDITFTADNILFAVSSHSGMGKGGRIFVYNTLAWESQEMAREMHAFYTKREWGMVSHISFTEEGELFAAGYNSGDIEIYSTVDWKVRQTFKMCNRLSICRFTPQDDLLFGAGNIDVDVSYCLKSIPKQNKSTRFTFEEKPTAIACTRQGSQYLAYNDGWRLKVFDLLDGDKPAQNLALDRLPDGTLEMNTEEFEVREILFSTDSLYLAVVADKWVKMWKKPTDAEPRWKCVHYFKQGAKMADFATVEGKLFFVEAEETVVVLKVLHGDSWSKQRDFSLTSAATCVKFVDNFLVIGGEQSRLKVYSKWWREPKLICPDGGDIGIKIPFWTYYLAYSPKSHILAVASKHQLIFFDSRSWRIIKRPDVDGDSPDADENGDVPVKLSFDDEEELRDLDFSPDGSLLLIAIRGKSAHRSGISMNKIMVFDIVTWNEVSTMANASDDFAFSPDGTFVAGIKPKEISITNFPPPTMTAVLASHVVSSNPQLLSYLASVCEFRDLPLPKYTNDFFHNCPYNAWIYPDLIDSLLEKVNPRSRDVGQETRNAIQAVLKSLTDTNHWQKLLLMDETVFERILLVFAKFRDPKLGQIFFNFIQQVSLILVPQPTDQNGNKIERFKEIPAASQFAFTLEDNALPYHDSGNSIWKDSAGDARGDLKAYLCPVKGICDITFLKELRDFSNLWNSQLFTAEIMEIITTILWDRIFYEFVRDACLYTILLISFTFTAARITEIEYVKWSDSSADRFYTVLAYITIILDIFYLFNEVRQFWRQKMSYVRKNSFFNVLQLFLFIMIPVCMLWGAAVKHTVGNWKRYGARNASAITILAAYLNLLYYLGGTRQTSWLITALLTIAQETMSFLFIIIIFLIAFTAAIQTIQAKEGEANESIWQTLRWVLYNGVLGTQDDYDTIEEWGSPTMGWLVFMVCQYIMLIIMLNAIIAFMGDRYSKVQESATQQMLFKRCDLLLEFTEQWSSTKQKEARQDLRRWIHILKPIQVDKHLWEGQLNAVKKYFDEELIPLREEISNVDSKIQPHLEKTDMNIVQQIKKSQAVTQRFFEKQLLLLREQQVEFQTAVLRQQGDLLNKVEELDKKIKSLEEIKAEE